MKPCPYSRRNFVRQLAGAGALMGASGWSGRLIAQTAADSQPAIPNSPAASLKHDRRVAIVSCKEYGKQAYASMRRALDLIGGIDSLVRGKTVTVKINMTGTDFSDLFGRPVGESYMTHPDTAMALGRLLVESGARRVRFVESTNSWAALETSLGFADWDIAAFKALGKNIEFENTRNMGSAKRYSHLKVSGGGSMFSSFDFNHTYGDTDVYVSLCKLKDHVTAGVTLSMKNSFGITPNALYGDEAGTEEARKGRGPLHSPFGKEHIQLPGLKVGAQKHTNPFYRVPHIIADINAARPIDLAVIDGVTSMSGGEGPWVQRGHPIKMTTPGIIIVGKNPVSTDAVGTAVMGYPNPRAQKGTVPFDVCENHILLAEQAGLGTADLSQIEALGRPLKDSIYPYRG